MSNRYAEHHFEDQCPIDCRHWIWKKYYICLSYQWKFRTFGHFQLSSPQTAIFTPLCWFFEGFEVYRLFSARENTLGIHVFHFILPSHFLQMNVVKLSLFGAVTSLGGRFKMGFDPKFECYYEFWVETSKKNRPDPTVIIFEAS